MEILTQIPNWVSFLEYVSYTYKYMEFVGTKKGPAGY